MIKSKMAKFQTFEKIIKNPSEVLENHLHHIMIEMDLLNQYRESQSSNLFRLGSRVVEVRLPEHKCVKRENAVRKNTDF